MRAFEIHTYQNGRWKIDAVFDDRSLALFEAKRMDEGNRFAGVRVVEESFDEDSQETQTRTIFRGGHAENQIAKDYNRAKTQRAAPARGTGREPRKGAGRPGRTAGKKSGFAGPLILLVVLVAVGLAGLFGLQHLFRVG